MDSGLQSIASLQAEARRMSASFGGHSLANGESSPLWYGVRAHAVHRRYLR